MKKKKYTCSCEYYYKVEILKKFRSIINKRLNLEVNFSLKSKGFPGFGSYLRDWKNSCS